MSDYIKKEEATSIPVIPKEHRKHFNNLDDAFETGWNEALTCVNMIPNADVIEVRHGYWILSRLNSLHLDWSTFECSVCRMNSIRRTGEVLNYCPNCGAKMDGKEQEHETSE